MTGGNGPNPGAIQRTELFAKVDEHDSVIGTMLKCLDIITSTNDVVTERLQRLDKRVDILNKRIRLLEEDHGKN